MDLFSRVISRRTFIDKASRFGVVAGIAGLSELIFRPGMTRADNSACDERSGPIFVETALAVKMDAPFFLFDIDYLRGPYYYENPWLRHFVHEVIHLWQLLGQGFLANKAFEQWMNLLDFEQRGRLPEKPHLLLTERLTRQKEIFDPKVLRSPNNQNRFSPNDLREALARYWDIHILSPMRLKEWEDPGSYRKKFSTERVLDPSVDVPYTRSSNFDEYYESSKDSYTPPYILTKQTFNTARAVVLFPLVGHCALQTPDPVGVFRGAILKLASEIQLPNNFSIHEQWRNHYPKVRQICSDESMRLTGISLTTGLDVIERHSKTSTHPLMLHYQVLLTAAMELGLISDLDFAIPGDPEAREKLLGLALPSATIFDTGIWKHRSEFMDLLLKQENHPYVLDEDQLAEHARSILNRLTAMKEAACQPSKGQR